MRSRNSRPAGFFRGRELGRRFLAGGRRAQVGVLLALHPSRQRRLHVLRQQPRLISAARFITPTVAAPGTVTATMRGTQLPTLGGQPR